MATTDSDHDCPIFPDLAQTGLPNQLRPSAPMAGAGQSARFVMPRSRAGSISCARP